MSERLSQADARQRAVRELYESYPYPPPVTDLTRYIGAIAQSPQINPARFHLAWPDAPYREDLDILVAGCGSAQAARYAARLPRSRVVGIDLSEASLASTRALQRKHGLDNLTLHQLPIERVAELSGTFDKIVCSGVLHHLPDPDAGLCALRGVLRERGVMRIMVYARYGRIGVYMMQEYCRRLGLAARDDDIDGLLEDIQRIPDTHPLSLQVKGAKDFTDPNGVADALLHPQDRAYTVPEVYAWLEACGMRFERWFYAAPYSARCGLLARLAQRDRLAALPPPEQEAAVELFRGSLVMHTFLAVRDDAPAHAPVDFSSASILAAVPFRREGPGYTREGAGLGAVSRLRYTARPYPDLDLRLDEREDAMYRAIDGARSVGAIAAAETVDPERGRVFFERLWHHDKIAVRLEPES